MEAFKESLKLYRYDLIDPSTFGNYKDIHLLIDKEDDSNDTWDAYVAAVKKYAGFDKDRTWIPTVIKEESPPLQITKATKEIEEAIRNMRPKPTPQNTELLTAIDKYLKTRNAAYGDIPWKRSGYSSQRLYNRQLRSLLENL